MTQLFMGYKPGVGPVLKILKYDTDNPLTLANDRYERYFFNSENSKLSYIFGMIEVDNRYNSWPSNGEYIQQIGGNASTSKVTVLVDKNYSWSNSAAIYPVARLKNIAPIHPYIPIPEVRIKDNVTGRVRAGVRIAFENPGIITHYQFPYNIKKVKKKEFNRDQPWLGEIHSMFTNISIGDWVYQFKSSITSGRGNGVAGSSFADSDGSRSVRFILNHWDLPADQSEMTTYTNVTDLETLRLDANGFILTRPGYSVASSTGIGQRIIDSNVSPSLCVMFGDTPSIPAGSNLLISPPSGVVLSDTAVADFLYKGSGQDFYNPPFWPSAATTRFDVSYVINSSGLRIYNDGDVAMTVRYAVFNTDLNGTSTGGNEVLLRGTSGGEDFIQIKKPGTSDPASKPNDILVDTRFPTMQIIKEGFLPASLFTTSGNENPVIYGVQTYTVPFEAPGMTPYLKYCLVFNDYILPPINTKKYDTSIGTWAMGRSSNQSCLARLTNNSVKFWMNKGEWSERWWSGGSPSENKDGPDPLGIRYYIFGVANK